MASRMGFQVARLPQTVSRVPANAGLGLSHVLGLTTLSVASGAAGAKLFKGFRPPVPPPSPTVLEHGIKYSGPASIVIALGGAYVIHKLFQQGAEKTTQTELKSYLNDMKNIKKSSWKVFHDENHARSIRIRSAGTNKKQFIASATQHTDYQNKTRNAAQSAASTYNTSNKPSKLLRKEAVDKARSEHSTKKPAKYDDYHREYQQIFKDNGSSTLDGNLNAAIKSAEDKFKLENPKYAQLVIDIDKIKTDAGNAYDSRVGSSSIVAKDREKEVNAAVAAFRKKNIVLYRQFKQDEQKCIEAKKATEAKFMKENSDAVSRRKKMEGEVTALKEKYKAELSAINQFDADLRTKLKEANKPPSVEDVKKHRKGLSEAVAKDVNAVDVPEAVKQSRANNTQRREQMLANLQSKLDKLDIKNPKTVKALKKQLEGQIKSLKTKVEKGKVKKGNASPETITLMKAQITALEAQLVTLNTRAEARVAADKAAKEAAKAEKAKLDTQA